MAVTVRALTASLGCEALKRGMASMMARGVTKAEALADCLEGARRGERELMAALDRYPHLRQELTALVLVASLIPPAEGQLSAEARSRGKARLMAQLAPAGSQRRGRARRTSAA
mgnify:CR=1 FL=1